MLASNRSKRLSLVRTTAALFGIQFLMAMALASCGVAREEAGLAEGALNSGGSSIGEALYRSDSDMVPVEVASDDDEPVRIPDAVQPFVQPQAQPEDPATASTTLAPNPGKFALKDFERRVIELTNAERQKRGLNILKVDGRLTEQCRRWSATMASQRNLYHSNMNFNGENVAWNQRTPEAVVTAWMNSPGHRANILRSSFKSIGVSMVNSNGPYWCQQFGVR